MDFEIGTVVKLKSGGPEMVISGRPYSSEVNSVNCTWFDCIQDVHVKVFDIRTLKYVEEKDQD